VDDSLAPIEFGEPGVEFGVELGDKRGSGLILGEQTAKGVADDVAGEA
jgi:hypothetical protein